MHAEEALTIGRVVVDVQSCVTISKCTRTQGVSGSPRWSGRRQVGSRGQISNSKAELCDACLRLQASDLGQLAVLCCM